MKKGMAAGMICVLSFVCMGIVFPLYKDETDSYKQDKNYAYVCVQQSDYQDMADEEYVAGTYWVERNQTVENNEREGKTSAVTVDFPVQDMLGITASLPTQDKDGCVVSSTLADELFGSEDIVGCRVMWQEKEYYIRSVFSGRESMLIVQRQSSGTGDWALVEHKQISGVVLTVTEEAYRGQYMELLSNRHNMSVGHGYYVTDYLNVLPNFELPAKWSQFSTWSSLIEQWKNMTDRKRYQCKDEIETFYDALGDRLQTYRSILMIAGIVFIVTLLRCIYIGIGSGRHPK